jgi:hypothetical protein
LRAADVAHGDETGWRVGRLNAWLWVFCTERVALCAIAQRRGREVPQAILGPDFDGILVVDGWSAYDVLSCQKGRCNGHILRRCRDLLAGQPGPTDRRCLEGLMAILRAGLELSKQRGNRSRPGPRKWPSRPIASRREHLWTLAA